MNGTAAKAKVDESKCIGCGKCAEVCPMQAIVIVGGKAQVNEALCRGCGACASVCPQGAIRLQPVAEAAGQAPPATAAGSAWPAQQWLQGQAPRMGGWGGRRRRQRRGRRR